MDAISNWTKSSFLNVQLALAYDDFANFRPGILAGTLRSMVRAKNFARTKCCDNFRPGVCSTSFDDVQTFEVSFESSRREHSNHVTLEPRCTGIEIEVTR